jgi:predicted nucleic acid-binding protein
MIEPNENRQHIYIDTYYIQSYLLGHGDAEDYAKDQVRLARDRARKNGDIFIKIPFLVAVELMNNVCRNGFNDTDKERFTSGFIDFMKDENVDFIPNKNESLKLAVELKDRDNNLDVTDLLIVSQALIDKYSTILLTNDGRLIDSPEIDRMKKREDRLRKLKISDSL